MVGTTNLVALPGLSRLEFRLLLYRVLETLLALCASKTAEPPEVYALVKTSQTIPLLLPFEEIDGVAPGKPPFSEEAAVKLLMMPLENENELKVSLLAQKYKCPFQ